MSAIGQIAAMPIQQRVCDCLCHYCYIEKQYFSFINDKDVKRENLFLNTTDDKFINCNICVINNCTRPTKSLKMSLFKGQNKNYSDYSERQIEFLKEKIGGNDGYESFLKNFVKNFNIYSKFKLSLDNFSQDYINLLPEKDVKELLDEQNNRNILMYILKCGSAMKFDSESGININEYFVILSHDIINIFNYQSFNDDLKLNDEMVDLLIVKEQTESFSTFNNYVKLSPLMMLHLNAINLNKLSFLNNDAFLFDLSFASSQWYVYQTLISRMKIEYERVSKSIIENNDNVVFENLFIICRSMLNNHRYGYIFKTDKFFQMIEKTMVSIFNFYFF